MAPDAWRCECGYTNLGSKLCTMCRRPRTAVAPADGQRGGFEPPPEPDPEPEPKSKPKREPARGKRGATR